MSITYFNSYYFNFLRKIKEISKPLKSTNDDAAIIYKTVKEYYPSYDKTSSEYKDWYASNTVIKNLFADSTLSYDDIIELLNKEEVYSSLVYKNISVLNIRNILKKDYVLLHFFALFTLFSDEEQSYDENTTANILECINNVKSLDKFNNSLDSIEIIKVKNILQKIYDFNSKTISETDSSLKELEETSLGKLAKEIMSDINIDEIQKSLEMNSENGGDILKSLANPDSGLAGLLSKISTTMIQKMASGSIKQEDLLKDAMKFSSKLGSSGSMPGLGDMGGMLNMMQKMTSGGGGDADGSDDDSFDMSSLQNIMKNMSKNMGNDGGGGKKEQFASARVDDSKLRRVIKQKQLKKKLDDRKKAKENI